MHYDRTMPDGIIWWNSYHIAKWHICFLAVPRIEPKVLHLLQKHSAIELLPQSCSFPCKPELWFECFHLKFVTEKVIPRVMYPLDFKWKLFRWWLGHKFCRECLCYESKYAFCENVPVHLRLPRLPLWKAHSPMKFSLTLASLAFSVSKTVRKFFL